MVSKIQDCRHRYCYHHTQNPEHITENNRGDQNRDTGYAKRIREQLGFEDISVHALQEQAKNEKRHCISGSGQQQYESADHSTDSRA